MEPANAVMASAIFSWTSAARLVRNLVTTGCSAWVTAVIGLLGARVCEVVYAGVARPVGGQERCRPCGDHVLAVERNGCHAPRRPAAGTGPRDPSVALDRRAARR